MLKGTFYIIIFILTYFGVEFFRRWSLKRKIIDIPNERSSHTEPTPRGGGLIIVILTLTGFLVFSIIASKLDFSIYYLIGSILIALISWLDDLFSISFGWRFLVHSIAAGLAIAGYGYWDSIYIPLFQTIEFSHLGVLITFCWIIWLTNAFNFMDGIDGIAGVQAVIAGLGWLVISYFWGFELTGILGGLVAFSSMGFLIHNWQPAKIFMGDIGSAFLGYTLAVIPLLALNEIPTKTTYISFLPIISLILVWYFLFDSLYTFSLRLLQRKKVWEAHREHIYQKMTLNGFSHHFVTIIYGVISLINMILLILWIKLNTRIEIVLILQIFLFSIGLLFLKGKKY